MNEIVQKTVLVSGGAGSMGQLVSDYINSRNDFIMTAIHDPNYVGQEYKTYKDLTNIEEDIVVEFSPSSVCLLYTSPSPRDSMTSRMPSSA